MKNKISNLSKEELIKILKESKSFKEVLCNIGYSSNGSGGYSTLKSHLKKQGIDIPKYHYYGDGKNRKKIELKDILVDNSTYLNRSSLKKRLVKEGLLKYECKKCGNNGNWNGKRLTLQLEHINGKNNDNRIENLIFLCPNCHSQSETYGGRNNKLFEKESVYTDKVDSDLKIILDKNKKYCECGVEIRKENEFCLKCSHKKRRKVKERPDKIELLKMIKNSSLEAVGRKYGVSGNAVKKWIK